jgi:hypothetical protein
MQGSDEALALQSGSPACLDATPNLGLSSHEPTRLPANYMSDLQLPDSSQTHQQCSFKARAMANYLPFPSLSLI